MTERRKETILSRSSALLGPAAMGLFWSPVLASVLYVADPLGWHADKTTAHAQPVVEPHPATVEEIAFVARELGEEFPTDDLIDDEEKAVTLLRGALPDDIENQ